VLKCKEWDLIKDGILVNYQAIRDSGQNPFNEERISRFAAFADNWSSGAVSAHAKVLLKPGTEK